MPANGDLTPWTKQGVRPSTGGDDFFPGTAAQQLADYLFAAHLGGTEVESKPEGESEPKEENEPEGESETEEETEPEGEIDLEEETKAEEPTEW